MYPPNAQHGRPPTGSEPKSTTLKFRIEPSLLTELKLTCQAIGIPALIPVSEAVRQAIILFIQHSRIRHY